LAWTIVLKYPPTFMYKDYLGGAAAPGLSSNDIARLQSLITYYGTARTGRRRRQRPLSARRRTFPLAPQRQSAAGPNGDISSLSDKDFYKVSVGLSLGGITVQLKTTGISSLLSRVTVYDSSYHVSPNGSRDGSDAPATLTGQICRAASSLPRTYYLKVEERHQRRLRDRQLPNAGHEQSAACAAAEFLPCSTTTVDLVGKLSFLYPAPPSEASDPTGPDARFDYAYKGSISSSSDTDYFSITSPAPAGRHDQRDDRLCFGGLDHSIARIRSCRSTMPWGNALPTKVLTHENGSMVMQYAPRAGEYAVLLEGSRRHPRMGRTISATTYFPRGRFQHRAHAGPGPDLRKAVGSTSTATPVHANGDAGT